MFSCRAERNFCCQQKNFLSLLLLFQWYTSDDETEDAISKKCTYKENAAKPIKFFMTFPFGANSPKYIERDVYAEARTQK